MPKRKRKSTTNKNNFKLQKKTKDSCGAKNDVNEQKEESSSGSKKRRKDNQANSYEALTAAEKEVYWQDIGNWCGEEFVEATTVCILRDVVYQRCISYCDLQGLPHPPNRATFGKVLQKTFRRLVQRRFGQRGESRYYYQGIDVMRDKQTVTGRVVTMSQVQKQNKVTFRHTKVLS